MFGIVGRWLMGGAAAIALAAAAHAALAGQEGARVYPLPAEREGDRLTVDVMVDDVEDLAGFQMVLAWNAELLSLVSIEETGFLAGTGREPFCPEPNIQETAVRLVCVTFAPPPPDADPETWTPPPGVSGPGTLARAEFEVLADGNLLLGLSTVKLASPDAEEIPSYTEDAHVTLRSDEGMPLWAWVAGGGGLVVLVGGGVGAGLWYRRRGLGAAPAGEPAALSSRDDGFA